MRKKHHTYYVRMPNGKIFGAPGQDYKHEFLDLESARRAVRLMKGGQIISTKKVKRNPRRKKYRIRKNYKKYSVRRRSHRKYKRSRR